MRRREFISLAAGTMLAGPLSAQAQEPGRVYRLALVLPVGRDEPASIAFLDELRVQGFVESQNLVIIGGLPTSNEQAATVVPAILKARPDVITTGGDFIGHAFQKATQSIPLVVMTEDMVAAGFAASMARPGGNITGISNLSTAMEAKRIGLLHEVVPQATAFGALLNPDFPAVADQLTDIQAAAKTTGVELHVFRAGTDHDIGAAFESITQQRIAALLVASDPFFNSRRDEIAALAARRGVPAMYGFRDYAMAGGLMSYGIDLPDIYRQAGVYAGRVLKGAKPADLPVLQPTKFEFVINLKTARALGLNISSNFLTLADEVIE
jgi:putative tryptophan/tyrosine transport system substrate-binding protein